MANYTDDRLADWNSRPAFPSTREDKGQQMTPKRPRDPNQLVPTTGAILRLQIAGSAFLIGSAVAARALELISQFA